MEQLQKYEMNDKTEGVKILLRTLARPTTINELFPQIKGFTKKEFETLINSLVASNDVIMKPYGNIKIYYYNFKSTGAQAMSEQSKELDSRISKYLKKTEEKQKEMEVLEDLLAKGIMAVPLADLEMELEALKKRVDKIQKEINETKNQSAHQVDPQERQQLKRKYDNYLDEFQKRKRMCLRVVDVVAENYLKPKKILMNDMQIETDEQVNFKIDDYKL